MDCPSFEESLMALAHYGRYDHQPIIRRPGYDWPNGRRLAVYIGLNLEHFAFGEGLGAELAPGGPQPDVLSYAWGDYGNRVGVWRRLELFDSLALPVTLLLNTSLYDYYPEVVAPFRSRGDEIAGHGRSNAQVQSLLDEVGEAALIAETTAAILHHKGIPPAGWLGRWIAENQVTPDLLAEAGYRYTSNWCHDDQPGWMRTRNGGCLLSVPYPQELNDIPAIVARTLGAEAVADMTVNHFEERRRQAERHARHGARLAELHRPATISGSVDQEKSQPTRRLFCRLRERMNPLSNASRTKRKGGRPA
jgi:allantoinase